MHALVTSRTTATPSGRISGAAPTALLFFLAAPTDAGVFAGGTASSCKCPINRRPWTKTESPFVATGVCARSSSKIDTTRKQCGSQIVFPTWLRMKCWWIVASTHYTTQQSSFSGVVVSQRHTNEKQPAIASYLRRAKFVDRDLRRQLVRVYPRREQFEALDENRLEVRQQAVVAAVGLSLRHQEVHPGSWRTSTAKIAKLVPRGFVELLDTDVDLAT